MADQDELRLPESLQGISRAQLQSSADVMKTTKAFLAACESQKYYIVTQPQLSAPAISNSLPHLYEALSHESVKFSLNVSEVLGLEQGNQQELVDFLKEKCGAEVSQEFVEDGRYGVKEAPATKKNVVVGGWTDSERKLGKSGLLCVPEGVEHCR